MKHFRFYTRQDINTITQTRRFETKLGETVQCMEDHASFEDALKLPSVRFVLFGIPEDIGIKANLGTGGADNTWEPFLHAFLNIQSSDFLDGEGILVAGYFNFDDIEALIESHALGKAEKIDAYRHAVNLIDEEVEDIAKLIASYNKIPIVIGGGHNNAYPLIKGTAKGLYKAGLLPLAQINCVNLDAQTDYRPMEGRHSGNGFRYADEDGYLQKYCVIGVHENHLPQNVWVDMVNNPFVDLITYEDIFLHDKRTFAEAVNDAAEFTYDTYKGIELDLDAIETVQSNSSISSGISQLHARQYINITAKDTKCAYLHICEDGSSLEDGSRTRTPGKLISYLVADFIKAQS